MVGSRRVRKLWTLSFGWLAHFEMENVLGLKSSLVTDGGNSVSERKRVAIANGECLPVLLSTVVALGRELTTASGGSFCSNLVVRRLPKLAGLRRCVVFLSLTSFEPASATSGHRPDASGGALAGTHSPPIDYEDVAGSDYNGWDRDWKAHGAPLCLPLWQQVQGVPSGLGGHSDGAAPTSVTAYSNSSSSSGGAVDCIPTVNGTRLPCQSACCRVCLRSVENPSRFFCFVYRLVV